MIEARGITKSYITGARETNVLRGVDLVLSEGEAACIVGASGAGKSTLLHILGSIDRPTSGEVVYRGRNFSDISDDGLAKLRNEDFGFVFQFHYLLPEFTALENVMMPLLIRGVKRPAADEAALAALDTLGLSERATHRPAELSGGEQQRVAVARAIVTKPKAIFADEPTGNLDSKTGKNLFELLLRLNKEEGRTLVIVTHNEELARMIPRRLVLADGKICDS